MKKISNAIRLILSEDRGDTGFVEWVILVGVIAILGIVAFSAVGSAIESNANEAANKIEGLSG